MFHFINNFFRSKREDRNIPISYVYNALLSVILMFGMKESAILANLFTAINLLVVTYLVICGLFKLDFHNWSIEPREVS